jgi:hypothetical protein
MSLRSARAASRTVFIAALRSAQHAQLWRNAAVVRNCCQYGIVSYDVDQSEAADLIMSSAIREETQWKKKRW